MLFSEMIKSHEIITPIFEVNDETGNPVTFEDYARVRGTINLLVFCHSEFCSYRDVLILLSKDLIGKKVRSIF